IDIIEKLKRYAAAGTIPQPKAADTAPELCLRLGGYPLNPDLPSAIRIVKEYPYTSFLPEPEKIFDFACSSFIHLPVLTRREFTEQVSLSDTVLFDLETTGLAGGTGT